MFKCLFRRSRPPIPGEAVLLFRAKASTDSEGDAVGIAALLAFGLLEPLEQTPPRKSAISPLQTSARRFLPYTVLIAIFPSLGRVDSN